jgi:hypothetical protein
VQLYLLIDVVSVDGWSFYLTLLNRICLFTVYPVYLSFVALSKADDTYLDVWNSWYGSVIYHWGMVVTMYCLHNISYGLPLGCLEGDDGEHDKPKKISMEWFLCKLGFGPENDPSRRRTTKNEGKPQTTATNDKEDVSSKKSVSFAENEEIHL